ncbi:hypothetical protein ARZXY2_2028 [Arthrobacter sp. ZXY-2]|nr:hypothetical protein ARZXY2_2028 [Arthrobacter sp. ZXY-2]
MCRFPAVLCRAERRHLPISLGTHGGCSVSQSETSGAGAGLFE